MTKDGGQAFPDSGAHEPRLWAPSPGMSLRDYFAAQFMALAQSLSQDRDGAWNFEATAACAYEIADAMLLAREPQLRQSKENTNG